MRSPVYALVTDTIVSALERGVVPWRKPRSGNDRFPTNGISQRTYRGVNVFLLALTPYSDHRWLTFKQVQEKGGRVRSGEKSTMVVFWKRWEPASDEQQPNATRPQIPLLRYFNLFNVEQCEGLDLPQLYLSGPEPEHQKISKADLLVSGMPTPPRITEGKDAWYRPVDDVVQIPKLQKFRSAEAYYATLFHELAHSTGHPSRLNRPAVTGQIKFGSGEYSKEELVAELASAFCCATVALDNSVIEDSASYIQGWLSVLKNDPKAIVIAAAQAQKAADHIRGVQYTS